MLLLILGLVLFLGTHSVRIVADDARTRIIVRHGALAWKGLVSLVSLAGLVLIVMGFGAARGRAPVLWVPPLWTHHVTALFTLAAFVLLAAAYVPGNAIRRRLKDPMVLGVKCWAFGHLVANGGLADVLLFGAFLLWAVLDFRAARRRWAVGTESGTTGTAGPAHGLATLATVLVGIVAWALFAFVGHGWLIGVQPFGGA